MAAYLLQPATASQDYSNVYGNISTYLNQVREELADIDVDTTASAATLLSIAISLGTMATNSTTMATNSTTMATNITTIATKLTAIETYQKKMKELGEGPGIRIVGPYEWLGFIPSYINYIEKGEILDIEGEVSAEKIAAALAKLTVYFDKINSLPTNF